MKKIIMLFSFLVVIAACGVKNVQKKLSNGDYDGAISKSVENLRTNKSQKNKQTYIYLLEEAFVKAVERDKNTIDFLKRDANPANLEKIFTTYVQLNKRQEIIKPVLPLHLINENRNAIFPFEDYSHQIIESKQDLSQYLYNNALQLLRSLNKMDARKAYDDLVYLEEINKNYKDVARLIDEARFKGTDFVLVSTKNETNIMIPVRLQNSLLDFSTYGLNDQWTVYHSNKQQNINYDYGLIIGFRQIIISPEQIRERQFIKEKQIKDGQKDLLDRNGDPVRDESGKIVKVDIIKDIRVNIYEYTQFKSCQVTAKIDYVDYRTNQLLQTFPLTSEFVFQHIYANYDGDRRAADDNYYPYFTARSIGFPSNEQMVYDTGEDLKLKLKNILTQNRFRR